VLTGITIRNFEGHQLRRKKKVLPRRRMREQYWSAIAEPFDQRRIHPFDVLGCFYLCASNSYI
jgi:hypothetical protein